MPCLSDLHARIQQLVHHTLQFLVLQLVGKHLGDSRKQFRPLKVGQKELFLFIVVLSRLPLTCMRGRDFLQGVVLVLCHGIGVEGRVRSLRIEVLAWAAETLRLS